MNELTGAKNVSIIVLDGHPQSLKDHFMWPGWSLIPDRIVIWKCWFFFFLWKVQDNTEKTWLIEMFSKAEAEKTISRFSRERKLNPNNGQKDRTERQHLVPFVNEIFYISYSSFL